MSLNRQINIWAILTIFVLVIIVAVGYFNQQQLNERANTLDMALSNSYDKFYSYLESVRNVDFVQVDSMLVGDKNKLIYYYLNDMCDDCIRQDLNELYKFQNLVGREYVKVCPVCWEDEEEYIPVKELLREFNAEICKPCNVYFPVNKVDGHRMRYFVFIDQDSNIKSVFIPRKNEQTTTQIYLQSLSHLLLE